MAPRSGLVSSPPDTDLSATPSNGGFAGSHHHSNSNQFQSSAASTPTSEDVASPSRNLNGGGHGYAMMVPPGVPVDVRDKHKRSYQACNECRARKIKCDQGPVDNPIPPPCARCRRENRPCTFSATRRKNPKKRKVQDDQDESMDDEDEEMIDGGLGRRRDTRGGGTGGVTTEGAGSEEEDPVAVLQQHETMSGLDSLNILGLAAARISAASAKTSGEHRSLQADKRQSQIAAWERLSFVRRELFSAQDGINYVNYFFDYLYPLTPILLPDYRNNQIELLEKDQILLVVILTIASRYMPLSGPGAVYRQSTIHEQLWSYLRRMIEKTLWAQEKFIPSTKKLRSFGTVEGLLLLTEWNPRALHSPLSEDDELMAPEHNRPKRRKSDASAAAYLVNRNNGLQEPCWRSDRMSWMLLSHAIGIAFELGTFDSSMDRDSRAKNLRILLPIYYIQLAGRLDLIGSLPASYLESLNSTQLDLADISTSNEPKLAAIYFWKELTTLIKAGNQEMFADREKTRELIKSKEYASLLDNRFGPALDKWLMEFESSSAVPPLIGAILRIEYEYTRVYLNSLALQAIVDRCANSSPVQRHVAAVSSSRSTSKPSSSHSSNPNSPSKTTPIPSHLFDRCIGPDRKYLDEITQGCLSVFRIVLNDLGPNLKYLSVRTFFRIIAVTVILLKTFALGAKENNILLAIEQMKRLIGAVREYIVDDIHIGNRFAHTTEALLERITSRLVRFNPAGNANGGGATGGSNGLETSIPTSPALLAGNLPINGHSMLNGNSHVSNGHVPTTADPSMIFSSATMGGYAMDPHHQQQQHHHHHHQFGADHHQQHHSMMLPPGMADMNGGGNTTDYSMVDPSLTGSDWMTLPLDTLFTLENGAEISASGFGPDVNGFDMLDVLLKGNSPN